MDLHECGRHDVGQYAILGTGITPHHCRRVCKLIAKTVYALEVPHVMAYSWGSRKDEWTAAHLGPIHVHMFTPQAREDYKLEELWTSPETFFRPGDFPHFPLDNVEFAIRSRLTLRDDHMHEQLYDYSNFEEGLCNSSQALA